MGALLLAAEKSWSSDCREVGAKYRKTAKFLSLFWRRSLKSQQEPVPKNRKTAKCLSLLWRRSLKSQEEKPINMACGACQFLRRKCAQSCIFTPYFSSKETGSDQFRAIHSVFGTRHFAKLLLEVPEDQRHVAASTILFEAESRVRYPIHGCYTNIYALREEVYVFPFSSLGFCF